MTLTPSPDITIANIGTPGSNADEILDIVTEAMIWQNNWDFFVSGRYLTSNYWQKYVAPKMPQFVMTVEGFPYFGREGYVILQRIIDQTPAEERCAFIDVTYPYGWNGKTMQEMEASLTITFGDKNKVPYCRVFDPAYKK
jgi:hypothetical protein